MIRYRRSRKYRKANIAFLTIGLIGMIAYMALTLKSLDAGIREEDEIPDMTQICIVEEEPYYQDFQDAPMPPLVQNDKQSPEVDLDALEEIIKEYPGFPYAKPNVLPDARNPLDGWVGRGLPTHPFYGMNRYKKPNAPGCRIKPAGKIPEPATVILLLTGMGLMVWFKGNKKSSTRNNYF